MRIAHLVSNLQALLRQSADALLSVLLSASCAACDQPLIHPTRGPICEACWTSILPLTAPLCARSADPCATWRDVGTLSACCPRCRRSPPLIDRARAAGDYNGALRAIVHA